MTSRIGRVLLVLILVLSVVVRNPMLLLLDAIVLIVIGTSWLWGRYCLAGVNYARHFVLERLFFGEETDVWIEVVNAKPLPLTWLKVEDDFPIELKFQRGDWGYSTRAQRHTLINLFSLRWYERVRRRYRFKSDRRGVFDLGPVLLSSGDLFGFRVRRDEVECRQSILVYPKIVTLESLDLPSAKPLGDFGSDRRIVDDPLRIAGAREYQAGDSVRHVHWKATAHRGLLQTKMFDPSASPHWVVLLNTQTLDHLYEGLVPDFLETAIVVAASLAHAGLEARRSVGLFSNSAMRDSDRWVHIPASRHAQQITHILEALAQLTHPPLMAFENLLRVEAPRLPYGASIFAVTPVVNEDTVSRLIDFHSKGHPVALIAIGRQPDRSLIPSELPLFVITQNWTEMKALRLDGASQSPAARGRGAV
jgi:uncharacterized protein (DUF58 family)